MLSIHSPNYGFTVLLSIFIKTHNHFSERHPSAINMYSLLYMYSKSDGVLCFHYSSMHIVNDMYHVCTYLCLQLSRAETKKNKLYRLQNF